MAKSIATAKPGLPTAEDLGVPTIAGLSSPLEVPVAPQEELSGIDKLMLNLQYQPIYYTDPETGEQKVFEEENAGFRRDPITGEMIPLSLEDRQPASPQQIEDFRNRLQGLSMLQGESVPQEALPSTPVNLQKEIGQRIQQQKEESKAGEVFSSAVQRSIDGIKAAKQTAIDPKTKEKVDSIEELLFNLEKADKEKQAKETDEFLSVEELKESLNDPEYVKPNKVVLSGEEKQFLLESEMYNDKGQPLTDQEKIALFNAENERLQDALKRPVGNVDMRDIKKIQEKLGSLIPSSEVGTVQLAASNIATKLSETNLSYNNPYIENNTKDPTADGQTGLSALIDNTQSDAKQVVAASVNALAAVLSEVITGKINPALQEEVEIKGLDSDTEFAELNFDLSVNHGLGDASKGMKLESFKNRLMHGFKKYYRNLLLASNGDPSIVNSFNDDVSKQIIFAGVMDSGIIVIKKGANDQAVVVATEKGQKFRNATKELVEATIAESNEARQSVLPVSADMGMYNASNYLKAIRPELIKRYRNPKSNMSTPQAILDFKYKLNNARYNTNNNQLGGFALVGILASMGNIEGINVDVKKLIGLDQKRIDRLTADITNEAEAQRHAVRELNKTVRKFNNALNNYSSVANGGVGQINPHKTDPSVFRHYPENLAVEVQNNLFNRALGGSHIHQYIQLNPGIFTQLESKTLAEDALNFFKQNYVNKGRLDSKEEKLYLILSNLLALHANLEGKRAEKLTWNQRVNEITESYIRNKALIGDNLKSAIAKLNAINEDGKFNPADLQIEFDPEGGYYGGLKQNVIGQNINLTDQEKAALNEWLSNSSKKDFGFRLSSYLAASDFVEAYVNNTAWVPKISADLDMNSAGTTFNSMDVGDANILSRVGLLLNNMQNLETDDIFPAGNPREFFVDRAVDLLDNLTDYRKKKIFKNADAMPEEYDDIAYKLRLILKHLSSTEKDFAEDFKGIILTTTYGKESQFHQDDANNLISSYPILKNFLDRYYDSKGDMVTDFSQIIRYTLDDTLDTWNAKFGKDLSLTLQMFNEFPEIMGYYGEMIPIGSESLRVAQDANPITITNPNGIQVLAYDKSDIRRVKDPAAKAVSKYITRWDSGKPVKELFDPRHLTKVINSIGPLLGQYRESVTLMEAVNKVNKDNQNPLWFAIVHDNLVVDGNGYAQYFLAVNNIQSADKGKTFNVQDPRQGSAIQVLEFDLMANYVRSFAQQIKDIHAKLLDKAKKQQTIDIGINGEYAGLAAEGDNIFDALERLKLKKNLDKEERFVMKSLTDQLQMFKNIGWVPREERGDSYRIPAGNLLKTNIHSNLKGMTRKQQIKEGDKEIPASLLTGNNSSFLNIWLWLKQINEISAQHVNDSGAYIPGTIAFERRERLREIIREVGPSGLLYFFS